VNIREQINATVVLLYLSLRLLY